MPSALHIPDLSRLRRRWLLALWGHYAALAAVGWLFGAGAVLGGWRLLGIPLSPWLWGGLGLALGALLAACLWPAFRRLPRSSQLVAMLDDGNAAGGLLCSLAEGAGPAGWKPPAPLRSPLVRLEWDRHWRLPGVALLFFLGCLFVPVPPALPPLPPLNIARKVDALEREIDQLAASALLEAAKAEEMKAGLKELEEKASGLDPVKTLEQLDYERQALENRALDSLQGGSQMAEAFKEAEAGMRAMARMGAEGTMSAEEQLKGLQELQKMLMEAQARSGLPMTPAVQAALDELRQALESLERQAGGAGAEGGAAGQDAALRAMMTPELMSKLAKAMQMAGADVYQRLQQYAQGQQARTGEGEAGAMLDPQALQEMLDRLEGMSAEELAEALRQMAQRQGGAGQAGAGLSAGMLMFQLEKGAGGSGLGGLPGGGQEGESGTESAAGGMPGSGGANRGRGDAALAFGQDRSREGKARREILPAARLRDLENSQTAGYSWAAPGESAAGASPPPVSGALQGTQAGAAGSRSPPVLPRHRQAVQHYFERQ